MRSPATSGQNRADPLPEDTPTSPEDALTTLYRRFAARTREIVLRIVDDLDDADDVVQEAFCAVLVAVRAGKGPRDSAAGYLYTVAKRAALRQRAIRQVVIAVGTPIRPPNDSGQAWNAEVSPGVATALAVLPLRSQAVLWLIDVEGYTPTDLAPALGLNPNAVSSLATRARRSFRMAYLDTRSAEVIPAIHGGSARSHPS